MSCPIIEETVEEGAQIICHFSKTTWQSQATAVRALKPSPDVVILTLAVLVSSGKVNILLESST